MNTPHIIKDFIRTRNLQEFINNRFKHPTKSIVDRTIFDYITTKTGETYYISEMISTIEGVQSEYTFNDIKKDDIVIDIGACIGGFSIPAAKVSDHVFAVEPIWTDELRRNIEINKVDVKVIDAALGDGTLQTLEYRGKSKTIKTMTFKEIVRHCGGCNFLKCDCEGYEWLIRPEDLNGIGRIEFEMHKFNPTKNNKEELIQAIKKNYEYRIKHIPIPDNAFAILSAKSKDV